MIYLVTTKQELFENNEYRIVSVEQSLALLDSLNIVGVDTETSGLSCHKDTLLSLQLGCYDFQVVIDCSTIDVRKYKTTWNLIDYSCSIMLNLIYNGYSSIE